MQSMLRRPFVFLAALLLSCPAVFGQATTVVPARSSRMTFSMSAGFASTLQAQGMHYAVSRYETLPGAPADGYLILSGSLDEASGYGEMICAGDLEYVVGSLVMDLTNLTFQSTAAGGTMTAAVYLNGVFQGRETVFNFMSVNFFGPVAVGPLKTRNDGFTFDPVFAAQFVGFFQLPQLAPVLSSGTALGFVNFSLVLQAPAKLKY